MGSPWALGRWAQARFGSRRRTAGEAVAPVFDPSLPEQYAQSKDHHRFIPSFSVLEPRGTKGQNVVPENPGWAARIMARCYGRSLLKCQAGPFLPETGKDGRFNARQKPAGEN